MKTVSFLASGRGSNFSAVAEAIRAKKISAQLGILISDNIDAPALDKAREYGMKVFHVSPGDYTTRESHEKVMGRLLKEAGTDLVVAAGYMRLLTPWLINAYRNKIMNIHPALLPAFPGIKAQQQALDYGVKLTGCTVHFIDEGTDTGPIILQRAVPVLPTDTVSSLASRILKEEHALLPKAVKLFCDNRITVKGNQVFIQNQ